MCILVQGFSIKKGTHAGNYDIFAVLEFFILELPGTLGPDACNFFLFCINDNKEFAPGSPGAGPGKSLLILYFKQCGICSREPRGRILAISVLFSTDNNEEFAPGSPGAGSGNVLLSFY